MHYVIYNKAKFFKKAGFFILNLNKMSKVFMLLKTKFLLKRFENWLINRAVIIQCFIFLCSRVSSIFKWTQSTILPALCKQHGSFSKRRASEFRSARAVRLVAKPRDVSQAGMSESRQDGESATVSKLQRNGFSITIISCTCTCVRVRARSRAVYII